MDNPRHGSGGNTEERQRKRKERRKREAKQKSVRQIGMGLAVDDVYIWFGFEQELVVKNCLVKNCLVKKMIFKIVCWEWI